MTNHDKPDNSGKEGSGETDLGGWVPLKKGYSPSPSGIVNPIPPQNPSGLSPSQGDGQAPPGSGSSEGKKTD